ncbi:hypothetical protein [Mycobacterium sp. TY815]|uniref:hypothetical protein n=1 Tax=Mycobacterium sp. TY815 TaxID=3050581 RepID=UPI0027426898|nr:hypothetical protein [Mycobacterium sp. TY815]MDP7705722.1 hypothetical protein [Mycobacterium sp. TY815]
MTLRPARLRLRRRLLIYSAPLALLMVLVAAKLISVVVAGDWAASDFGRGDAGAVRDDAAVLGVANLVEPAKASFAAGAAAVLDGRLEEADADFTAALARTDVAGSCPVRVNLELVREAQGDRAAAAGDRSRADERYASALSVVGDAPPVCFADNSDPDTRRQTIRRDAANRLADKRNALNAPPAAPAQAPPPPPPPAPVALPLPVAVSADGRDIPPRRLDPTDGDPLDKLQQVLQDAAGAAPPG